MPAAHVSRVRALYRRILQLHRALPPDLKALGDQYVKDEFRRHKTVGAAEAQRFLQEWEASGCPLLLRPRPLGSPSGVPRCPRGFPCATRDHTQRQPVPCELNSAKLSKQYLAKLHADPVCCSHRFLQEPMPLHQRLQFS